jgi:hypothetical protein
VAKLLLPSVDCSSKILSTMFDIIAGAAAAAVDVVCVDVWSLCYTSNNCCFGDILRFGWIFQQLSTGKS